MADFITCGCFAVPKKKNLSSVYWKHWGAWGAMLASVLRHPCMRRSSVCDSDTPHGEDITDAEAVCEEGLPRCLETPSVSTAALLGIMARCAYAPRHLGGILKPDTNARLRFMFREVCRRAQLPATIVVYLAAFPYTPPLPEAGDEPATLVLDHDLNIDWSGVLSTLGVAESSVEAWLCAGYLEEDLAADTRQPLGDFLVGMFQRPQSCALAGQVLRRIADLIDGRLAEELSAEDLVLFPEPRARFEDVDGASRKRKANQCARYILHSHPP